MPLDPTLDELSSEQQRQMTHQPEQPNPAAPWLEAAKKFSSGGLTNAFPQLRQRMPGFINTLGDLAQSPAARDVFSTANIGGIPLIEIMGGERGFAELAARGGSSLPLEDLELAKQMHGKELFDRSQIMQSTGWYRDPTKTWNKEIFDKPSTLNKRKIPTRMANHWTTVGEVLNHPDLYEVYPHLKDMPLLFTSKHLKAGTLAAFGHPNAAAGFPNGVIFINTAYQASPEKIRLSLLHELTHVVDTYEGRTVRPTQNIFGDPYFRLIEEARARNTEYRSDITPEQLKKESSAPWQTMQRMRHPYKEEDLTP